MSHPDSAGDLLLAAAESRKAAPQEPASNSEFMMDHFKRNVLQGFSVRAHRPTGSKETRARIVAAAAENGYVKLVPGPHTNDFLDEIAAFPHADHDDVVDALSGAHHALGRRRPPWRSGVARGDIWDGAVDTGPGFYPYPWHDG